MLQKILFIFAIYLPFQVALNPLPGIDLASIRLLIVAIFLFWLFWGLYRKNIRIPTDPISVSLYCFLFFASFSLFFAENPLWGTRKLLFLFSIFPILFFFRKIEMEKIFSGLVYGSFAASLVGLAQFFAQFIFGIEKIYSFWGKFITPVFLGNAFSASVLEFPSWLVNIAGKTVFRAISIFPDPHMFSFYLGMTAPLALALYFHHKKEKKFFLLAFIFILLALLLTFARGGYLGLLASILTLAIYLLKNARLDSHNLAKTIFISFVIIVSFFSIEPLRSRFLASFDFEEGSNRGRIEMWTQALATIKEHPMGVGIGNLPLAFVPTASYRDPIYAHNLYLDIAAELGVFALLSFLAALLFSFRAFAKTSQKHILFLGALLSLSFFATYSLVETPLYSVHILPLLLILLSLSNTYESAKNN